MIKLSLDISTSATGIVIQKDNEVPVKYKLLLKRDNKLTGMDAVADMGKQIANYVKGLEFDIMIVSKATSGSRNMNVTKMLAALEGIALGIACIKNIPIDYFPDVSWYAKIGDTKDTRDVKKPNSLKRFLQRNSMIFKERYLETKKEFSGKGLKRKLNKISAIMKDGEVITDDIADAFNAGDLYEKRLLDYQVKIEKNENAIQVAKLMSKNKMLRKKNELLKSDIKNWNLEITKFKKEFQITKSMRSNNKIDFRNKKILTTKQKIKDNEQNIITNNEKATLLRREYD